MKSFNLIKTKAGERTGKTQSCFYGDVIDDNRMLGELESYLRRWLEGYNNSLSNEEINELFEGFDGNFNYDVWTFELEEDK